VESAAALQQSQVSAAVHAVRSRIAAACERVGRNPREVTLVGVTKTVPAERVRDALDHGISHLGESRLQEAIDKMRVLSDRAPTWHFIGHLQGNKARRAVELFDVIASVDSLELAERLEAGAEEIGRELRIHVQVKLGDEPGKHGIAIESLPDLVTAMDALPSLTVVGLMAIPPRRPDAASSRADFRLLKRAFDDLRAVRPEIEHLSMGMSSDFEMAIEEGATEVRVGTLLFGAR